MSELVRFSLERADQIVGFFRIGPARRHYTLGYFRMQWKGGKDRGSIGETRDARSVTKCHEYGNSGSLRHLAAVASISISKSGRASRATPSSVLEYRAPAATTRSVITLRLAKKPSISVV